MFQRLERGLIQTGNPVDKKIADAVKALRKIRGEDISLEESRAEISRFSEEQLQAIKDRELILHENPLSGQSIKSLRDAGMPFWSTWHKDKAYRALEILPSRTTQVATLPGLFLPESNSKSLTAQLEMVARLSEELEEDGLRAVIGKVPDYVELAFNRRNETGEYLFGTDYHYDYARTETRVGSDGARVGDFRAVNGLYVGRWYPDSGHSNLWAAPLVVPA